MLQVYDRVLEQPKFVDAVVPQRFIACISLSRLWKPKGLRSRVFGEGVARGFEMSFATPLFETTFAAMLGRKSGTV